MARQAAAAALTSTAAAAAGTAVADVYQSGPHVAKLCAAVECEGCSGSETPVIPRCIGKAARQGRQGGEKGQGTGSVTVCWTLVQMQMLLPCSLQLVPANACLRLMRHAGRRRCERRGWVCCCRSLLAFCDLPAPRSALSSAWQRQPGPRGAGQTWRSSRQRCGRPPRRSTN